MWSFSQPRVHLASQEALQDMLLISYLRSVVYTIFEVSAPSLNDHVCVVYELEQMLCYHLLLGGQLGVLPTFMLGPDATLISLLSRTAISTMNTLQTGRWSENLDSPRMQDSCTIPSPCQRIRSHLQKENTCFSCCRTEHSVAPTKVSGGKNYSALKRGIVNWITVSASIHVQKLYWHCIWNAALPCWCSPLLLRRDVLPCITVGIPGVLLCRSKEDLALIPPSEISVLPFSLQLLSSEHQMNTCRALTETQRGSPPL